MKEKAFAAAEEQRRAAAAAVEAAAKAQAQAATAAAAVPKDDEMDADEPGGSEPTLEEIEATFAAMGNLLGEPTPDGDGGDAGSVQAARGGAGWCWLQAPLRAAGGAGMEPWRRYRKMFKAG